MKFKSVEISGFRIYDDPKDATFDFTINQGEAANFISIYAPNGFGKTSFYDAVEWGVTNNIQRFWQKESLTEKSITVLRQVEKVKLLDLIRNKNSTQAKSFVHIKTDQEDFNRPLEVHGNRNVDLEWNGVFENKKFQQVILSQEWISAFLKEVDGVRRYELFIENPDLKGINDYYRNMKGLVAANLSKIQGIRNDIIDEEKKVKENEDLDLLENVNHAIEKLVELKEEIETVKLTSTEKDVLQLNDQIAERLVGLTQQIEATEKTRENIGYGRTGNSEILGVNAYFSYVGKLETLEKELVEINDILLLFSESKQLDTEKTNLTEERSKNTLERSGLLDIIAAYPHFKTVDDLITQAEKELDSARKELGAEQSQVVLRQKSTSELNARLSNGQVQERDWKNQLSLLPDQTAKHVQLLKSIGDKDQEINKQTPVSKETDNAILIKEKSVALYESIINGINGHVYDLLKQQEIDQFATNLLEQENWIGELANYERQVPTLDKAIKEQEIFNDDLQAFVSAGINLINKSQPSDCPFCKQTYADFQELSMKVTANASFQTTLQVYQEQRTSLVNIIAELKERIKRNDERYISYINNQLQAEQQELNKLLNQEILYRGRLLLLNSEKQDLNTTLSDLNSQLGGRSPAEHSDYLNKNLEENQSLQKQLMDRIAAGELLLSESNEKIAKLEAREKTIEKQITDARLNKPYQTVRSWKIENYPVLEINLEFLTGLQNELTARVDTHSRRIAEIDARLKELTLLLSTNDESRSTESLKEKDDERAIKVRALDVYRNFLGQELKITISENETIQSLNQKLTALIQDTARTLDQLKQKTGLYLTLEKYQTNILPYLQSEIAKVIIEGKQKELTLLESSVQPMLEKERDNIKEFLEKQIKSFFYTELINQIYNKIDPHPEYKFVEFKANFDSEEPTLDILVVNANLTKRIVPNLYFSAAQMNILSLSIFLASALNSPEYDCIFIDDPIQSMDSINVLSMIDLLRSLVVNENKQIILSTHDLNFHNLLKKKMPPRLFKSKFLQLETFGKVKVDTDNIAAPDTLINN